MIIECINCNKKFEVDSSLIPQSGRNLQCGLCDHKWFYKNSQNFDDNEIIERDNQKPKEDQTSQIPVNLLDAIPSSSLNNFNLANNKINTNIAAAGQRGVIWVAFEHG